MRATNPSRTIAKATEFGKLVTIQESEHQIIAAYAHTEFENEEVRAVRLFEAVDRGDLGMIERGEDPQVSRTRLKNPRLIR